MFFKLWINGKEACVAGADTLSTLQTRLMHDTRADFALLLIDGNDKSNKKSLNRLEWVNQVLHVGDEIRIQLLDSATADRPKTTQRFGETESASDKKQIDMYCSFCGRNKKDVDKLIAGHGVFICSECIGVCSEILEN